MAGGNRRGAPLLPVIAGWLANPGEDRIGRSGEPDHSFGLERCGGVTGGLNRLSLVPSGDVESFVPLPSWSRRLDPRAS
jgi:hypothetical protein